MRSMTRVVALGMLLVVGWPALVAGQPLTVSPLFADQAVLQRDEPVVIFGSAAAGAEVRVSLGETPVNTQTDDAGRWRVKLPAMSADGTTHTLTVSSDGQELRAEGLVVGEVWLASGQSNMAWPISKTDGGEAFAQREHPMVRVFKVPRNPSAQVSAELRGRWSAPGAGDSAVALYFAEALQQELGVPVGVIVSAVGGTPVESWISQQALDDEPAFASTAQAWAATTPDDPAVLRAYDKQWADFSAALETWQQTPEDQRGDRPRPPATALFDPAHPRRPAVLYNGMIAPLESVAVRGVLWYQGEGNSWRARQYAALLNTLFADWRRQWDRPQLPFGVVQLAGWKTAERHRDTVAWLREAQARVVRGDPHAGMVVSFDLSRDDGNIHPSHKRPIGQRLADWALREVYHLDAARGPRVAGVEVGEGFIEVVLELDTPLVGDRWEGWELAGRDGRFVPAEAERVEADRLRVTSPEVDQPRAVRYAWSDWPRHGPVLDQAGYPLPPLRSDDQPDPTADGGM